MATICDNPFSIPAIDLDECIGTSLATINSNFQELKDNNCLTFDETERIQTDLVGLSAQYFELSSYSSRAAKAWIGFNGVTMVPFISYNIKRLSRTSGLATGGFSLSFTDAFPTTGYAIIGICNETQILEPPLFNPTSTYAWVQPTTFTTTSADINIRNLSGSYVNPDYVSIIIYSN